MLVDIPDDILNEYNFNDITYKKAMAKADYLTANIYYQKMDDMANSQMRKACIKQAQEKTKERKLNSNEYLNGQRDCKDGVQHVEGKHPDYDAGYASQYEAEQLATELGLRNEFR